MLLPSPLPNLPAGLHSLVSVVARPVKHSRLLAALLKADTCLRSRLSHAPPPQAGTATAARMLGLLQET